MPKIRNNILHKSCEKFFKTNIRILTLDMTINYYKTPHISHAQIMEQMITM